MSAVRRTLPNPASPRSAVKPPSGPALQADSMGWAEFESERAQLDSRFADTQPLSILPNGRKPTRDPRDERVRPSRRYTVDEVMVLARRNNRVCPRPEHWLRLYDLLPNKRRTTRGWQPSVPLTGPSWKLTSWMLKRLTLREHIEWAAAQGVLSSVAEMLRKLPDEAWLHMGENTGT